MFTGEQISERNILDHMEQIERRAIQIIAEYAKGLAGGNRRGRRRPSVMLVSNLRSITLYCMYRDFSNPALISKMVFDSPQRVLIVR